MENLTETKLTSEKIYSGCILDFYRDTVRLPNGGTAPRELTRHVIDKTAAILTGWRLLSLSKTS